MNRLWACLFLTGALSAHAQVDYQNVLPKNLTPAAKQYRTLWLERTKGENLARGVKVLFSLMPDWTNDEKNDPWKLTDGRLSARNDDRIWFDKAAIVGWRSSPASMGMNWLLDLGTSQPVGRVVVRFLGGGEQRSLKFPAEIVLVASQDGKTFHKVGALQKLEPGERELDGHGGMFFLPEEEQAYTYPFLFDKLNIQARYIGLRVRGATDLVFSDELSVIKGDASGQTARLEQFPPVDFVMKGIYVAPDLPLLAISTNIVTPNWFYTTDIRRGEQRNTPVTYAFDLPSAVEILQGPAGEVVKDAGHGAGVGLDRWLVKNTKWRNDGRAVGQIGPFYFHLRDGAALPEHPVARFSVLCAGVEPRVIEVPIRLLEIPTVPKLSHFHVGVDGVSENVAEDWPGYFEAWGHMGFNSVNAYPRYWSKRSEKQGLAYLEEARKRGMAVNDQDSPFHVMLSRHPKETDFYSQLSAGPSHNFCPSYRGPWYKEEIQRIADDWAKTRADHVYLDIECTYGGANEAEKCARCKDGRFKSGKPMAEYLADQGTGMIRDIREAIQKRAAENGRTMPALVIYDNHAARPLYGLVFSFPKLFPKIIDLAAPSLYVQGDAQRVHDTVRQNYALLRSRVIIPWLSAGTYGHFEPYKVEGIVLESLLNGSMGIEYYCFSDFNSPLYFYHHARALALAAPYEQLLKNGDVRDASSSDAQMAVSAWGSQSEALVLVGNYQRTSPAAATVTLPFTKVTSIRNVRTGEQLAPGRSIMVRVSDKEPALFDVKGSN
jgi:hypothetical protein